MFSKTTTRWTHLLSPLLVAGPISGAASTDSFSLVSLPQKTEVEITGPRQVGSRLKLETKQADLRKKQVDPSRFSFAKHEFLEAKRDEAIRIMRQQLDSDAGPNRANLLLRLGQLYVERYMELSYRETELYTQQLEEFEKRPKKGKADKGPELNTSRSKRYVSESLKLFYELEKLDPHHPSMDEVLYFIGFVEVESGNGGKGAPYLQRVIREFPKSRKHDEAQLFLGDYYFQHSKFEAARDNYQALASKVNSPLQPFAAYKLAWCELNLGKARAGLARMRKLVTDLEGEKEKGKFNLREQAVRDLVVFFAESGTPKDLLEFYTDALDRKVALENLRLMADILRSRAQDDSAVAAYQLFLKESPGDEEAPQIELAVHESLTRMSRTQEVVAHLEHLMKTYGPESDWASRNSDNAKKTEVFSAIESEARKSAYFFHMAAQKGRDKKPYSYALTLYSSLLTHFPKVADRKKILFYRAEILFDQRKFVEAADAYLEVSKIAPKDKLSDEAMYNALLALDELVAKADKVKRFTKKELENLVDAEEEIPQSEQKFISVAENYISEMPKSPRAIDVRYRIAAIYYRHHHFDKARDLFDNIIKANPSFKGSATAAYLVVDLYGLRKDYMGLSQAAERYANTAGLGDAAFKKEMKELISEIEFKKIEQLEKEEKWAEAGKAYFDAYSKAPNSPLSEKSLYNAQVSAEKAKDSVRALELATLFIAKYPKSGQGEGFLLRMAKTAERNYDFEKAQDLFAQFSKLHPKHPEAAKARYNAAVFAQILGNTDEAIELFNQVLKSHEDSKDRQAVIVSLAKLHAQKGNWPQSTAMYRDLSNRASGNRDKAAFLAEAYRQLEAAKKEDLQKGILRDLLALYERGGKKDLGAGMDLIAEDRLSRIQSDREKYSKITFRFPPADLVYLLKRKQNALKKLASRYDEIVSIGVPEVGVLALKEKAAAYGEFVETFQKVEVPAKYSKEEKQEAKTALDQIRKEIVEPLGKKAKEFFVACVDKAREFKVGGPVSAECAAQAQLEISRPSGIIPRASYWSFRAPLNREDYQ